MAQAAAAEDVVGSSGLDDERTQLLAQAWSTGAAGYAQELVPRLLPWAKQLVALLPHHLPQGGCCCPGCGPGDELILLAKALPGRRIVGIDMAPGMTQLAQQMIEAEGLQGVSAQTGDATKLPPELQPAALIFSCFTMQQLPDPDKVLAAWLGALAPGGILAVCFWPKDRREQAFTTLSGLFAPPNKPTTESSWESQLVAVAQSAGARVLIDEQPAHSMSFDSAAHFFNVMMSAGPAQARLTAGGPEAIADTRQRFLAATQDRSPFVIAPSARMMVLQAPDAAL